MRTLAGTYSPQGTVRMGGIKLPAFDKHRVIEEHEFHVFESDCRYDVILGGDFLEKIGMNLLYQTLDIEWLGNVMPMETINRHPREELKYRRGTTLINLNRSIQGLMGRAPRATWGLGGAIVLGSVPGETTSLRAPWTFRVAVAKRSAECTT